MIPFVIVLEPSQTGYGAFSPDVLGCVATGRTVEATLAEMRVADPGDLITTIDAGELYAKVAAGASAH
jgi:hypothetical protein